jgi:hypothetical protein
MGFINTVQLTVLSVFLLTGCAHSPSHPAAETMADSCERMLNRVDTLVENSGASDAGSARIEGFPHLRLSRFLVSFVGDRPEGPAYRFWLESLRRLDAEARSAELRNLPEAQRQTLHSYFSFGTKVEPALDDCAQQLMALDLTIPERRQRLLSRAKVPAAYVSWHRAFGLYPIVQWPFYLKVLQLQRELGQNFRLPPSQIPVVGKLTRYSPAVAESLSQDQAASIMERSSQNPLNIPQPNPRDLERLFDTHAPVWEVDTTDDNDRMGRIRLMQTGRAEVDTAIPSVYRLVSHTRFQQRNLLQLVYMIWFPARTPEGVMDIYAGAFDGVIWRVTLSEQGRPLAYDSIHPCGCYYHLFPGAGFRVKPVEDGSEPVFSPKTLANPAGGERLVIRLSARKHFIQQVYPDRQSLPTLTYRLNDYNGLRSLEIPGQRRQRSFFDDQGFVPCSQRLERFLFWPMGIKSAGAMRQWGNHAIAFIGSRHFDDPGLLQKLLRVDD